METESSLLRLQERATCPYPEPDQSSPYPIPFPDDPSQYYPLIYAWLFPVDSLPQVSPLKNWMHPSSTHPSHSSQ